MRSIRRFYQARAVFYLSDPSMTWKCHVCMQVRPDRAISVLQRRHYHSGGVIVTENIRYCNDNYSCAKDAHLVFFTARSDHEKDDTIVIIHDGSKSLDDA